MVVVGAGIAGLAAAWELLTGAGGGRSPRVVVLDAAAQVGGKLALGEVGGVRVDLGAESVLARRPEAVELAREVGLGDELETPRPVAAALWSRGRRYALPTGTVMGVPSSGAGLDGLLDPAELREVLGEPGRTWPSLPDDDVDVASLVAARVGPAVVDRLVDPLLGGVYAGRAAGLSLRATVPALWDAAAAGRSLVDTAREVAERGAATQAPVFAGLRGGVGRLPIALRRELEARGARVHPGTTVRSLERTAEGWRLVTGPASAPVVVAASAVLLATPARPAARLLADVAPVAAAELAAVEYASVAIVTMMLDRAAVSGLEGSGVLVPPADGRYVKAATFSSSKWGWLDASAAEHVVVRASVGRFGDVDDLQLPDDEIVRRVLADLRALPGVRLPEPHASVVTRWGGGLPQYAVGHLDRVDRVLRDVARRPGLAVAGAAYEGVGVPACIASGRRAAGELLTHLAAAEAGRETLGP